MLKTCSKSVNIFLQLCGRLRSELPLEEKVFIHAELTPMAKLKKPIVTITKVGLVEVQIKTAPVTFTPMGHPRGTGHTSRRQAVLTPRLPLLFDPASRRVIL